MKLSSILACFMMFCGDCLDVSKLTKKTSDAVVKQESKEPLYQEANHSRLYFNVFETKDNCDDGVCDQSSYKLDDRLLRMIELWLQGLPNMYEEIPFEYPAMQALFVDVDVSQAAMVRQDQGNKLNKNNLELLQLSLRQA